MRHFPEIFDVPTIDRARQIILTPEAGLTTDERWRDETRWLVQTLDLPAEGVVADYGCGVGRMCAALRPPMLGIDSSPQMRALANDMLAESCPGFAAVSPVAFDALVNSGLQCSAALAIWSLQHMRDPRPALETLRSCLYRTGGRLHVVNRRERLVPIMDDGRLIWADDGLDIDALLAEGFAELHREPMPERLCAPGAFLSVWRP